MVAPKIQKKQRTLGMYIDTAVSVALATIATAACGVAIRSVFVLPNPYPEMMRGLKFVMPAFVTA